MTRKTAHFRIVMPEGMKGTLHSSHGAQLFVTFPGTVVLPGEDFREVPIPEIRVPATWAIDGHWGLDDPVELTIKLYGSVEVEYP